MCKQRQPLRLNLYSASAPALACAQLVRNVMHRYRNHAGHCHQQYCRSAHADLVAALFVALVGGARWQHSMCTHDEQDKHSLGYGRFHRPHITHQVNALQ